MRTLALSALLTLVALLTAACANVRSISNPHGTPGYRGELSEFDVIGVDPKAEIDDAEIRRALSGGPSITLTPGSSILLIQSGAEFPDDAMRQELSRHFRVSPFSGHPEKDAGDNYSRVLRLAAARGGHRTVVCYWGIIESATQDLATKGISWVPIVGSIVPDETQTMRVRVKMIVLDVRTGRWESLAGPAVDGRATSMGLNREGTDVRQVERLKAEAYRLATEELLKRFAG